MTRCTTLFLLLLFAQFPARAGDKPNIVILLADDLGWADVGYHGGAYATPHIDGLAEEGVRLENFHTAPLCSPTRAGLMTGRWPIRYGMGESVITPWRKWGLPTTEHTIADLLAGAGYTKRGAVGKWHLGHYRPPLQPLRRGFTSFYGHYNGNIDYFTHYREGELDWHRDDEPCRDAGYSTDLIGEEAARFIRKASPDAPFFLYVPFNAPHTPFQAKEEDMEAYRQIEDPRHRAYAGMVAAMDRAIGRILGALEERHIEDDTFVLFFSDNGGIGRIPATNGPWRGHKGSVYEGGIRVPAIVRWPAGLKGGRSIDDLVGYIDVYPTLKALAGIEAPDPNALDGINLLPLLQGRGHPARRSWFSYIAQGSPARLALTEEPWKLVVLADEPFQAEARAPSIELFHLARDPAEKNNLAPDEPARVTAMLERLETHYRLKIDNIPHFREGAKGFKAPKDWVIRE